MRVTEFLRSCPSCGAHCDAEPYDIGDGPELCCPVCDWCWGAVGQILHPVRPDWMRQS